MHQSSHASPLGWIINAPFDLLAVVARRLWSHLGMMLALAAGFTVAIALVVAIPVYAEAVGYRVLRNELSHRSDGTRRPPFTFMYRYLATTNKLVGWEQYAKLDGFMRNQVAGDLALPVQTQTRYVATDKLPTLNADGSGATLLWAQFAFADKIEQQIEIVDGRLPQATPTGPVEVMITEELASKAGFQVGEEYLVLGPKPRQTELQQPIKIVGIWRAKDADDQYWFYLPTAFDEVLLLPEQSFRQRITSRDAAPIYVALWYFVTDGSSIRSESVPEVGGRIVGTINQAANLLPGTRLEQSPLDALINHQREVQRLTVTLTMFSVPIFLLIGYFVVLVSGLVVQRQSNEISVLRSRGASRSQVMLVYLLEALLLGLVTLALGLVLGQGAALAMAWTKSFLTLEIGEQLPISLTNEAWQRAWQMLALVMLASLLPALAAARYTIVSFRAERARQTRPPLWQRMYLDLLLLVPVGYAYYMLRRSGPSAFGGAGNDPFANPLLLLAPTLGIAAFALISLRLFPLIMRLCAWFFAQLPGIAALTAFRSMARAPILYTRPLLLLTLTLSLATFTASMAATLDSHLTERAYYETGGVLQIADYGQSTESSGPPGFAPPEGSTPVPSDKLTEARFLFLPVSDYLTIPGVEAVARVGRSKVNFQAGGQSGPADFLGVDRAALPGVMNWRDAYAGESLGSLLNQLADDPAAVIVSQSLAAQGVRIGDPIILRMNDLGARQTVTFQVVGFSTLFPTLYPEDQPFIIGNLDYAFDSQGGQYPYEVWARLAPGTTTQAVFKRLGEIGMQATQLGYAPEVIGDEQLRPERQGVFGLLSVGFLAAALLTAIGFLFYTLVMFQRRVVEIGALRAIGLGAGQLGRLLAWEQGTLIVSGLIGGTLIGVGVSQAFIPFLQVRAGDHALTPPFVVQIAWQQIGLIYLLFGSVLVVVMLLTMLLLRRMRLFEAVKLGEAI